jgi:hypothetical protein
MKNKNKKLLAKKGSILVFSIFVMMISLVVGISLMSTSVVGRKSTLSSSKTVNSFQVADSGIEYAYDEIRRYRWSKVIPLNKLDATDLLDDVFGVDCVVESGHAVVNGSANGGTFKLYFFRGAAGTIVVNPCNSAANSRIQTITKIKSVGTYNGITRSVEADINMSTL